MFEKVGEADLGVRRSIPVEGRVLLVAAARHRLAPGGDVAAGALEVLGVVAVTGGLGLRMQAEALVQVGAGVASVGEAVTRLLDQCFRNGCGVMVCRLSYFF